MVAQQHLFLGSKSSSRQMLLRQAQIPFLLLTQVADESQCDWDLPLPELVQSIALHKMQHVAMPDSAQESEICFVLTADTMSVDNNGVIHGKPIDKQDAIKKIIAVRDGAHLCTAFCLEKKVFRNSEWQTQKQIVQTVHADYIFDIPDEWIEIYLEKSDGLYASGAIAVEGFGAQFLKTVSGSYSTIIGLPLFEVRQALEQLGFFILD